MQKMNLKINLTLLTLAMTLSVFSDKVSSEGLLSDNSNKLILFENLYLAENEQEGRIAEAAIWQFWFDQSPAQDVRAALDAGIQRREAYDFEAAEHHFDRVIMSAPDYAEGYNQRAFIRFLRENYDDAQADLEIALKLEPNHFAALSGLYHILQRQNRRAAALGMLKRAVEIHPWIKERSALPKDFWPENYRKLHDPGQKI